MRVKLYAVYLGHDNPKYNTVMKLARAGMVLLVKRPPPSSITLDPLSPTPISASDANLVRESGLTVIDGSWRKIRSILGRVGGIKRRLPLLIAANTVNYGHPFLLSSAEALAAALYIAGFRDDAYEVLSKFKWGSEFFRINGWLLEKYEGKTSREIVAAECSIISDILGRPVPECDEAKLLEIYSNVMEKYVRKGI